MHSNITSHVIFIYVFQIQYFGDAPLHTARSRSGQPVRGLTIPSTIPDSSGSWTSRNRWPSWRTQTGATTSRIITIPTKRVCTCGVNTTTHGTTYHVNTSSAPCASSTFRKTTRLQVILHSSSNFCTRSGSSWLRLSLPVVLPSRCTVKAFRRLISCNSHFFVWTD